MATIADALAKNTIPYSRPPAVKVKCILKKNVDRAISFTFGTEVVTVAAAKHFVNFGIADGQTAIKAVSNIDLLTQTNNMEEGGCYIIKGYTVIKEKKTGQEFFFIKKETKIFRTGIFEVTKEAEERAIQLIEPPSVQINIGERTPERCLGTLQGTVDTLSKVRRVVLPEGDVPIKDLSLVQEGRSAQVSLWREAALNSISVGQHLTITHLRWTPDKNAGFKWNSTSHTTVKASEEGPRIEDVQITGLVENDQHFLVFCENEVEYIMKPDVLQQALKRLDMEEFVNRLPTHCKARIKGDEIIAVLED